MQPSTPTPSVNHWVLAFILPNLGINSEHSYFQQISPALSLGLEGIAIVPFGDSRFEAIRRESGSARVLAGGFKDENSESVEPSALLIREDYAAAIGRDVAPVVAFRNAVALTFILPARARLAAQVGSSSVSWADFFDFHPTVVGIDNKLHTHTPAVTSMWVRENKFLAMPDPSIAYGTELGLPDPFLSSSLGKLWWKRFIRPKKDDVFSRLVFRSLELAYHACSLTNKNQASLNDYGLQVALWVTALEVLARPTRGDVNQSEVLRLIKSYPWENWLLSRNRFTLRFRSRSGGWNYSRGNAVQKACNALYHARHRFIHGDKVDVDLMIPQIGSARPALPRLAATVYRAALGAFLERRYQRSRSWDMLEYLTFDRYEKALANLVGQT
ncbi:MAG TPA: hypothetical protein VF092_21575 [Longimicrobium sp.]